MYATKSVIYSWLMSAKKNKATHMLVCTDTYDYSDYPVEVKASEDVRKIYNQYQGPNMQKVMEVYNLSMDIEAQLDCKGCALNFDDDWTKEPFLKLKNN